MLKKISPRGGDDHPKSLLASVIRSFATKHNLSAAHREHEEHLWEHRELQEHVVPNMSLVYWQKLATKVVSVPGTKTIGHKKTLDSSRVL